MRCNICNKALGDSEVIWNKELGREYDRSGAYEPCVACLTAAMEAAYCDGFVRPDDMKSEDTDDRDGVEVVEQSFDEYGRDSQYVFAFDPEEENLG